MESYPLFVPPSALTGKSRRDWSNSEAQAYFDWLMQLKDERVDGSLRFFEVSGARDRQLLLDLGGRVAPILATDECSDRVREGMRTLTNTGYAVAADMGLLTAHVLVEMASGSVRWEILKKPRSDISYNLPVLTGFGKLILDPIGGSISEAEGILRGVRGPDVWIRTLDFWFAKVD